MLGIRVVLFTLCLGVAAVLPSLAADDTPLAVKPGLWEMTTDSQNSGAPPIPQEMLDKMPPEQRAKVEAAIQQSMGPRHRVDKHCVTQAEIDKGFEKMERMSRGDCTQTVASSSSTLREGSFACSGAQTATGIYRFEASNPESVVVTWDMTMANGGKAMKMKIAMLGKWLGADCGSVKDIEIEKTAP